MVSAAPAAPMPAAAAMAPAGMVPAASQDAEDRQGAAGDCAGEGDDRGLGGAEPGQVGVSPAGGSQQRVLAGAVAGRGVEDVPR